MKLTIELVPSTSWYSNVRSNVSKAEWDKIIKTCYKKANYKCEICKDTGLNQGYKHPVECHEIWSYNDVKKEQVLEGLIALCPKCHKVKHTGLAFVKNEGHIVIEQLMSVNEINVNEAERYVEKCFEKHKERSKHDWKLDISYLEKYK
jgi:hypothetical protein